MNINLIIGCFYPAVIYGGPIFSTMHTCLELGKLGHNVFVSTTDANGNKNLNVETNRFLDFAKNVYVKYYSGANHAGFSIRYMFGLWIDIKNNDVIFLQSVFSSYVPVTLLYSWILNKPVLLSPRGSFGDWCLGNRRSIVKRLWLRLFISSFSNIVTWHATADQEKENILSIFPRASVVIVPNGIDQTQFSDSSFLSKENFVSKYTSINFKPSHIIISMGRLHKKKGFDILVNAFNLIKNDFSEAVLLIAGSDSGESNNLQNQIITLGLKDRVFLVGELQDKNKVDFLANADLFVLPSYDENFGNVYAESLAAGTPVIASTHTPWAEVERLQCGKWIPNTASDTADAIKSMLNSDLITMGQNGKQFIADNFSWPVIAQKFENVFARIKGQHYE